MTSRSNGSESKRRPRAPARQRALSLLARRMLSASELEQRLIRRGYQTEEIADAMALVESYGYIDDAAMADAVRREAQRTCRGPLWVRQTLERRKVSEAMRDAVQEEAEKTARDCVRRFVTTRYGAIDELEEKQRTKVQRQLLSRGFTLESVLDILDETG